MEAVDSRAFVSRFLSHVCLSEMAKTFQKSDCPPSRFRFLFSGTDKKIIYRDLVVKNVQVLF